MWSRLLFTVFNLLLITAAFAQIGSVGIVGDATPGGWDNDTPMERISDDEWTVQITLIDGPVKFRADGAWTINWGSADFPSGIGVQDGNNIPVFAGDYTVTFNSTTGEYFFDVDSDIGIVGDATPGGWDNDTKMYRDQTDENKYFLVVNLVTGPLKFRANGNWEVNWGSMDFPTGVGTQNGDNIPIPSTLKYRIDFDKSTGAYAFSEVVDFTTIGLVGDATPGGWDNDTPLNRDNNNPDLWRGNVLLVDGPFKFRANNSWTYNWGGTDFPSGVAVEGGDNITAVAGNYQVTFNSSSLEYNFLEIIPFETIGLVGDATPGGWDVDTPLEQDPNDPAIWRVRVILTDGPAKFRANNEWVYDWGSGDFPTGVGVQFGANIPIVAGDYFVVFNSVTGAYSFTAIVEYDAISIVGVNGPFGAWPGDDDSFDTYLTKDQNDINLWTLNSITLTEYGSLPDSGIKFRANASWTVNWGAPNFPSGVGTQNGPNIEPAAGTYRVVFKSDTGEYAFSDPTSTQNLLSNDIISIFPNPARDVINLEFKSDIFRGEARVNIFSMKGELVYSQTMNLLDVNIIPAQNLKSGTYILQIANDRYVVGKQLIIAK